MALRNLAKVKPEWEETKTIWQDPFAAYALQEVRTQWDYELEGYFLAHCLGTKNAVEFNGAHRVFSLRDKLGFPHCTVLLHRDHTWSPYGVSRDMISDTPMSLQGDYYYVLQVRGRTDRIARWEYYMLVRQWYLANGGEQRVPLLNLKKALQKHQDTDLKYHYGYLLDESVNHFNWSFHNKAIAERYRKAGLSL